jgi:hypothetical protein
MYFLAQYTEIIYAGTISLNNEYQCNIENLYNYFKYTKHRSSKVERIETKIFQDL